MKNIINLFLGTLNDIVQYSKYKFKNPTLKIGGKIKLRNCTFAKYIYIGRDTTLLNVKIGNCSYTNFECYINNCIIGNYCSIGPRVLIGLGEHPTNLVSTSPCFYSQNVCFGLSYVKENHIFEENKKTIIGNDVWIGANVFIKDGVVIGNGVIIAAGSVILNDIESYSIIGGVPGKFIKKRFSENTIKYLENIQWWNKDKNWIIKNIYKLHDDINK